MAWCAARIAVSVCVGRSVSCRLADVEIGTSVKFSFGSGAGYVGSETSQGSGNCH